MSYTPMMQQYLEIKQNYKDAILFFRLGDFYEMFFEDALTASGLLEITLTGREAGQPEKVPMCGIPYHAAEVYINRLIQKGCKVAICEQTEDPSAARGIVKREVVRVVTPGTIIESSSLDEKNHNYIVSIFESTGETGLAVADISTGLFQCTRFSGQEGLTLLLDELERIRPAEVVMPLSQSKNDLPLQIRLLNCGAISFYDDRYYTAKECSDKLNSLLGSSWQEIIGGFPAAVSAAGSLLSYLYETQKKESSQIKRIAWYASGQYMMLDRSTRRNLELTASIRDGGKWGTLIWVLDHTRTAMGGRLIRSWVDQPLTDYRLINDRLDAVEEIKNNSLLRLDLKKILGQIYDLERLASRAVYGTANARDLLALAQSLGIIPCLAERLLEVKAKAVLNAVEGIDPLTDICGLLQESITPEPPATVREGGLIRDGYSAEVDRLRNIRGEGKNWLVQLESEERESSGIRSLKIGYNKVFGYYLEVTRANLHLVPSYYIRKQTLANAERYITPRLKELEDQILTAGDRLTQLEYTIFSEIREKVASAVDRIQKTSASVAFLDAILSLAEAAVEENYNRPRITKLKEIIIKGGRHPVVEKVLGAGSFVPNDTDLSPQNNVVLLTGPNMAGKSTYMRQVALLVIMAQMGSFVPAQESVIGVVDRVYTRIGASDDLAGGQSTFMVEMMECKNIVAGATDKSLVLMDEVGRGTSTYDGISIARSLVEYIVKNLKSRTLFSTHYHELTDLEALEGIKNYTVSVKEQDQKIIFLRKVVPGKADRSYGIHVAALAGLPPEVTARAREILDSLECSRESIQEVAAAAEGNCGPIEEDNGAAKEIIARIKAVDTSNTTPLAALNILAELKSLL
ncbi:MAG: DNA mismatch repair protein MutS [Peptococcaceae bacterium BICA1-7]|nr:MAG: DNA mismatch repair protein MutS [Peptococcaceae bacterium BICA1-7]HBV96957.1 DNA mismatch repair protein MutS [Desulfotomaculum sp.]